MSHEYITRIRLGKLDFKEVPRDVIDFKLCMTAINVDGLNLQYVPRKFLKEVICRTATFINFRAIEYVPTHIIEGKGFIGSVAGGEDGRLIELLADKWPHLLTKEFCLAAVKKNPCSLASVPVELLDDEICKAVVTAAPKMFVMLPVQFQKDEYLEKLPLKSLPENLKDYGRCLQEVEKQGNLLKYVPPKIIDDEMVKVALKSSEWALRFVPSEFFNKDFLQNFMAERPNLPAMLLDQAV